MTHDSAHQSPAILSPNLEAVSLWLVLDLQVFLPPRKSTLHRFPSPKLDLLQARHLSRLRGGHFRGFVLLVTRILKAEVTTEKSKLGGVWAEVNRTCEAHLDYTDFAFRLVFTSAGLQLNSLLYRFHPAVIWSCAFPHRDEILGRECNHTLSFSAYATY
jgi:hypothetical protein